MSKNYSREDLAIATESDLNSTAASVAYNVPASTIRQHRRQPFLNGRRGRLSYLTPDQENYLVSLFKLLPDYGFEVTKDLALQLSLDYFKSLDLTTQPGTKWLRSFVKRHENDIIWKRQEKLERIRAESFTEETRSGWFATLNNVLQKYNLFDKPQQIFNCDETGFADKTKGQWVIVNLSCRHIFEANGGGGKDYRTALICISAGGQVLPPFILYSGKYLMDSWCKGGPPGTQYGVTPKGWINTSMYEYWLENLFIPSTSHLNRPLLPTIDGHASHISLKIINLLKSNQIICLMLPSHSTHALQPLDVVVFNSVKIDWSKLVKNHLKDGNKSTKNSQFPQMLKKLFIDKAAFSRTRIVSSFARAGIWPFDADAMRDKVVPSTSTLTTTASNVSAVPTNILQPNSSMSSMLSCSSASSSVTSVSKFVNTSNADPTDTALRTSTFNDIIPIQPTIVDDDIQLFNSSDMSTYTTLQSCPLDLTINHRPKNKRATSSPERSYKSRRNRINNDVSGPSTSTPVVAVRRVINTLLSERTKELQNLNTKPKPPRGKRLPNNTGLNITDDEFVLSKLKENEEMKNRKQKASLVKDSTTPSESSSTANTTTTKRRGRPPKKNKESTQPYSNDPEIQKGILSLQSVITMADSILDSDDSEVE